MSIINVTNLTFAYDGSYDNIFENVSFQIDTDWKLGFTGRNGRGKTTFLNLLLKKYEYSGTNHTEQTSKLIYGNDPTAAAAVLSMAFVIVIYRIERISINSEKEEKI